MRIEYTEFIRPNGKQKKFIIEMNQDGRAGYEAMQKAGGRLTLEHLPNNTIHICIEKPDVCDYSDAIVQNHARFVSKGFLELLKIFDPFEFESMGA